MQCGGKNIRYNIQYFLHLVLFSLWSFLLTIFLVCIVVILCVFVVFCICFTLCLYVVLCVYLLCYVSICCAMCIVVLTLDFGLLARSQYPEGPATGHFDTGFSCVYK